MTPRIDRSRAIPSRGSAGWVGRAILFVLRLADGDASAVRKPRASSTRPGRKTIGRGANEQRAATVVMAAAPECHRVAFKAGASVCVGPSKPVRMISLFDNTLIQYVFHGPYNTSSGHLTIIIPIERPWVG